MNLWVIAGLDLAWVPGRVSASRLSLSALDQGRPTTHPSTWEAAQGSPAHRITCQNSPHRAVSMEAWGEDRGHGGQ